MSAKRILQWLLLLLILTLLGEGLARKILPLFFAVPLFFLKDIICIALLAVGLQTATTPEGAQIRGSIMILAVALLPCFLLTFTHDPFLAVFGAKQYLLFSSVAVALMAAFPFSERKRLVRMIGFFVLSVVATSLLAAYQNHLPAGHWLNRSTEGANLKGFSAAGRLRVSSSFSFVAQYVFYLNALSFLIPSYFVLRGHWRNVLGYGLILILGACFIVGTFITGSRSSVIGNLAVIGIGAMLLIYFSRGRGLAFVVPIVVAGVIGFGVMTELRPEFFVAYEARAQGRNNASHSQSVINRLSDGLIGWTKGSFNAPPTLMGYGLGVMSNGTARFSKYAAYWRETAYWTETDQATTFFEGGWYLMFVWYGFRLWVILQTFVWAREVQLMKYSAVCAFAWAFVLIFGTVGTLAIQPPLCIYWWLAVGLIACMHEYDRTERRLIKKRAEKKRIAAARQKEAAEAAMRGPTLEPAEGL